MSRQWLYGQWIWTLVSVVFVLDAGIRYRFALPPMKIKLLLSLSLLASLVLFTACVSTVDGRMKSGVPFLKDTKESRYERTIPEVAAAVRTVLQRNGKLEADNSIANSIQAKVDTSTVFVRLYEVDPRVTHVQVQARKKFGGADVDLASEIDKQIALQLAAGR